MFKSAQVYLSISRNTSYRFVSGPDAFKLRYWVTPIYSVSFISLPLTYSYAIPLLRLAPFMLSLFLSLSFISAVSLDHVHTLRTLIPQRHSPARSFPRYFSFISLRALTRAISIGSPLPHQEWITLFSSEEKILSLGEHVLVHLLFSIASRCMPAIGALP